MDTNPQVGREWPKVKLTLTTAHDDLNFEAETYVPADSPNVLTGDDGARLRSIASAIQQAVDDGRFGPDFAERDVRYLRKLADYAKGDS
jgi:hypothetical protein